MALKLRSAIVVLIDIVMNKKPGRPPGKGLNPDTIGGGFVQETGSTTIPYEARVPKSDEIARPATGEEDVPHPKPWTRLPRNRRGKLAVMGLSKDILSKGDPRYATALRLANKYRKARSTELAVMHGHVSSGASALLASASLALAASRFLYEKFAETSDRDEPNYALLKQAASLADSARQSELAAWEMSAREGMVKRKLDAQNQGVPWLRDADGDKAKPGRKTNAERSQERALGVGQTTVTTYASSADRWIHGGAGDKPAT